LRATREIKALDLMRRVEQWIEDEMQRIRPR
jgi:hypothetical protein